MYDNNIIGTTILRIFTMSHFQPDNHMFWLNVAPTRWYKHGCYSPSVLGTSKKLNYTQFEGMLGDMHGVRQTSFESTYIIGLIVLLSFLQHFKCTRGYYRTFSSQRSDNLCFGLLDNYNAQHPSMASVRFIFQFKMVLLEVSKQKLVHIILIQNSLQS